MIQIRNVPSSVHRLLKIKAAKKGTSLSQLLLEEIKQFAHRPEPEDLYADLRELGAPKLSESISTAVRRERDTR